MEREWNVVLPFEIGYHEEFRPLFTAHRAEARDVEIRDSKGEWPSVSTGNHLSSAFRAPLLVTAWLVKLAFFYSAADARWALPLLRHLAASPRSFTETLDVDCCQWCKSLYQVEYTS